MLESVTHYAIRIFIVQHTANKLEIEWMKMWLTYHMLYEYTEPQQLYT